MNEQDFYKKYEVFFNILKIMNIENDKDYNIIDNKVVFNTNNKLIFNDKNPFSKHEYGKLSLNQKNKISEYSKGKDLLIPNFVSKYIFGESTDNKIYVNIEKIFNFEKIYFEDFKNIYSLKIKNDVIKGVYLNKNMKNEEKLRIDIYSKSLKELAGFPAQYLYFYSDFSLEKINNLKYVEEINFEEECFINIDQLAKLSKSLPKLVRINGCPDIYKIYSESKRAYVLDNRIKIYNPQKIPYVFTSEWGAIKKINQLRKQNKKDQNAQKTYFNEIIELNGVNNPLFKKILSQKYNEITQEDKQYLFSRDINGNSIISYCLYPLAFKAIYDLGYQFSEKETKKVRKDLRPFYDNYLLQYEFLNKNKEERLIEKNIKINKIHNNCL